MSDFGYLNIPDLIESEFLADSDPVGASTMPTDRFAGTTAVRSNGRTATQRNRRHRTMFRPIGPFPFPFAPGAEGL